MQLLSFLLFLLFPVLVFSQSQTSNSAQTSSSSPSSTTNSPAPSGSGNSASNNSSTSPPATTTSPTIFSTVASTISGEIPVAPSPGESAPGGIYGPPDGYIASFAVDPLQINGILVGLAGILVGGALI